MPSKNRVFEVRTRTVVRYSFRMSQAGPVDTEAGEPAVLAWQPGPGHAREAEWQQHQEDGGLAVTRMLGEASDMRPFRWRGLSWSPVKQSTAMTFTNTWKKVYILLWKNLIIKVNHFRCQKFNHLLSEATLAYVNSWNRDSYCIIHSSCHSESWG